MQRLAHMLVFLLLVTTSGVHESGVCTTTTGNGLALLQRQSSVERVNTDSRGTTGKLEAVSSRRLLDDEEAPFNASRFADSAPQVVPRPKDMTSLSEEEEHGKTLASNWMFRDGLSRKQVYPMAAIAGALTLAVVCLVCCCTKAPTHASPQTRFWLASRGL
eukprot:CAMPEP_0172827348 /NCGR_PEP_ID=MMETSP1075-20121228/20047_1 /TAXON_ID=2916 /ORGANISM="Ceratium fusus, Strain PA161109" /LENGTH=160 /DNA_ID=CAMNT_0013669145 /DNA_START=39 /DNA_END=521 /DNA_ORIENTATION=-